MKTEAEMLEKARIALLECFADVLFAQLERIDVQPKGLGTEADMQVLLDLPDGEVVLLVEVKNNGQPRIVRNAVEQISRWTRRFPRAYGVFVAPYISPISAEILSRNNIGYVDLAGNCRLSFWPVYISREGKSNPFSKRRDLRSLYSPKASRVVRVLLLSPNRSWRTNELANEANVSLGQVANVKKLMEDREWLRRDVEGFRLAEPDLLLAEWTENYSDRGNQIREFYSIKSVSDLECDLAQACQQEGIEYALTGFSGAARLAPYARYRRATAYVRGNLDRLVDLLGLREVTSGANIALIEPYDEGVFYGSRSFDEVAVASPVQVYLDLKAMRGRGEDAAGFLLDQVIRRQWN